MKKLLLFPALVLLICAQPAFTQQPGKDPAHVTGTVVNSATGQPVAGALVIFESVHYTEDSENEREVQGEISAHATASEEFKPQIRRIVTDVSGRFSFDVILPASMDLSVSKRGFRSESDQEIATVLVEPEDTRGSLIRMTPLGVIQGAVVNGDGDPLEGLTVQAVRIEIRDGRRQLRDYAANTTDDRGQFRLWNLSPGSYYLRVGGRQGTINSFVSAPPGGPLAEAYGPVYFPLAPVPESARPLDLKAGQTMDADFKLEEHATHQIRGTLLNMPPRRAVGMRLLRTSDALGNRALLNTTNGSFAVFDVAPGSYVLQAYTSDTDPILMGEMPVTIGDKDLTGITIPLSSAIDVEVRTEMPPPAAANDGSQRLERPPLVRLAAMNPQAFPRNYSSSVFATRGTDGRLFLRGLLPGKYDVAVTNFDDLYATGVRDGTTDVLAEGLTVSASGPAQLTVSVGTGGGHVRAVVDGVTPDERWVGVLFNTAGPHAPIISDVPQSGLEITSKKKNQVGSELESEPGVEERPLAPGTYDLYIWPASKNIAWREPDAFSALHSYLNVVQVKKGENEVSAKAIPAEAIP